jgi:hypothetical protein
MEDSSLKAGDLILNKGTKVAYIMIEKYEDSIHNHAVWKMFSTKTGACVKIPVKELRRHLAKGGGWEIIAA